MTNEEVGTVILEFLDKIEKTIKTQLHPIADLGPDVITYQYEQSSYVGKEYPVYASSVMDFTDVLHSPVKVIKEYKYVHFYDDLSENLYILSNMISDLRRKLSNIDGSYAEIRAIWEGLRNLFTALQTTEEIVNEYIRNSPRNQI